METEQPSPLQEDSLLESLLEAALAAESIAQRYVRRVLIFFGTGLGVSILLAFEIWRGFTLSPFITVGLWLLLAVPSLLVGLFYLGLRQILDLPQHIRDATVDVRESGMEIHQHFSAGTETTSKPKPGSLFTTLVKLAKSLLELKSRAGDFGEILLYVRGILMVGNPLFLIVVFISVLLIGLQGLTALVFGFTSMF